MHFTHYQITGGKVFAVNPHRPNSKGWDYEKFKDWLSTQPTITADPSIKDGVYKVDELEIVWQYYVEFHKEWRTESNQPKGAEFLEYGKDTGVPTRLYATLKPHSHLPLSKEDQHKLYWDSKAKEKLMDIMFKDEQPVKQEEKEVKGIRECLIDFVNSCYKGCSKSELESLRIQAEKALKQ